MSLWVNFCRAIPRNARLHYPGEFNRSTQHPSLERTDCWCRSNFSIKSQDIRHRSRSFERLRRYPPILAALPALSALCLQLRHEPCPCMSLHMHAIPTWRIRVKGRCVDRLSPPPQSCHTDRSLSRQLWANAAWTQMASRPIQQSKRADLKPRHRCRGFCLWVTMARSERRDRTRSPSCRGRLRRELGEGPSRQ